MTARASSRALALLALREGVAYAKQGALMSVRARDAGAAAGDVHARVFVHGLHAGPRVMFPMMHALDDGTPQLAIGLSGRTVEDMARALAREIHERAPHATLDLVGHSLGGLVLRWMLLHEMDPARVRRFITLGAPHHGTRVSQLLPGGLMRQLRPGSPLLRALADRPLPANVHAISIAARHDQLVRPHHHALLPVGDHVVLEEMGHGGLLMDRRAHDAVRRALFARR